jgi:hypothetical protein
LVTLTGVDCALPARGRKGAVECRPLSRRLDAAGSTDRWRSWLIGRGELGRPDGTDTTGGDNDGALQRPRDVRDCERSNHHGAVRAKAAVAGMQHAVIRSLRGDPDGVMIRGPTERVVSVRVRRLAVRLCMRQLRRGTGERGDECEKDSDEAPWRRTEHGAQPSGTPPRAPDGPHPGGGVMVSASVRDATPVDDRP